MNPLNLAEKAICGSSYTDLTKKDYECIVAPGSINWKKGVCTLQYLKLNKPPEQKIVKLSYLEQNLVIHSSKTFGGR